MFVVRRANLDDVPALLKPAKMVHFINLPADKDIIADKAMWSEECFLKAGAAAGGVKGRPGRRSSGSERRGTLDRGAGPVYAAPKGEESGLAASVSRSDMFMFVL